jgi:hypothetical protein
VKKLILIAFFLAAACIVVAVPALLPVGRSASPVLASAEDGGQAGGSAPDAPVEDSDRTPPDASGETQAAAENDTTEAGTTEPDTTEFGTTEPGMTERPVEQVPHPGMLAFAADRCDLCHTVYAAGIGQPPEDSEGEEESDSMDLSDVGSARDAEWLLSYLRKEAEIDGVKHYRAFKGTEEEEAELVEWLATLGSPADSAAAVETAGGEASTAE